MNNSNKKGVKVGKKKKVKVKMPTAGRMVAVPRQMQDSVAMAEKMAYLRLLNDPCNAPLVQPTYMGEGTGLFIRVKTLVTPLSNSVDYMIQFCPPYIANNAPNGAAGFASPIEYVVSAITGNATNTIYGQNIAPTIFGDSATPVTGLAGSARCIAACIKVHYTGSELNRQGLVGASLSPGASLGFLTASGASGGAAVSNYLSEMPQVDRLGSRVHEYKWVPSVQDQEFVTLSKSLYSTGGTVGGVFSPLSQSNVLQVAITNAPAGSVMFEVTSCWEYTFNAVSASGGLVRTTVAPPRSTLNETLRYLGNVGQWALAPETQTKALQFAQSVGGVIRTAGKVATTFASLAL